VAKEKWPQARTTIVCMMYRKFLMVLIGLVFTIAAFAVSKGDEAVTMVSYEQSSFDSEGTLALRNNTDEIISNVTFQITYLDMKGNALDYEKFFEEVTIDPGMTKKVDLPAYEYDRNYHYFKTKDDFGHPAFKIEYKLLDYNTEDPSELDESIKREDSFSFFGAKDALFSLSLMLVILFVAIGLTVGLYVLVAVMAKDRNRSVVAWVLLSILASPLLMIIILLVIGNNDDY